MKIYRVFLAENYQFFSATPFDVVEKLQVQNYSDLDNVSFDLKKEERKLLGDVTIIESSLLLLFSKKAKECLQLNADFLSLPNINDFELIMLKNIDALDFEKSEIDYFSDGKRIKRVKKYSFKKEKILEKEIFSIKIGNISPIFVSEKFVEKFKKNKLTGLDFSCVQDL